MNYNEGYYDCCLEMLADYEGVFLSKDDCMDYTENRIDIDVDSIPDSDTREDDLITLIDLKHQKEKEIIEDLTTLIKEEKN